jgi:UDP-N-acetylglucosamine 4,6-dehydratase
MTKKEAFLASVGDLKMANFGNHSKDLLNNKVVLVTGGTGSFGKEFVKYVCQNFKPKKLIIFSRDELKQFEMAQVFSPQKYPFIKYFVGDVRDKDRLYRAFDGVDVVIHAAALKQVPTAEINPSEVIKTNIEGSMNIIDAAMDKKVSRVVALSTDKACNPINLYGATKLCSEKLFVAGNRYAAEKETRFSVVRYGNVVGSRGSVVPFFKKMKPTGVIPITDERMTRFFITLEDGVKLVLLALENMYGGEIYIPKIPSMKISDLATLIAPECKQHQIGIRPGEKINEMLISEEEARSALEFNGYFIVEPEDITWRTAGQSHKSTQRPKSGFSYSSSNNTEWLTDSQMMSMIETTGEV